MNDVLINAFVARIKAGMMTLEQVPIPYQEEVRMRLEQDGAVKGTIEATVKVVDNTLFNPYKILKR